MINENEWPAAAGSVFTEREMLVREHAIADVRKLVGRMIAGCDLDAAGCHALGEPMYARVPEIAREHFEVFLTKLDKLSVFKPVDSGTSAD